MRKKKILVWETLPTISGGQKMTLTVMDMLSDQFDFCCLIPAEGMLSEELRKRGIPYYFMGDQTLPTGIKGKRVILRYGVLSLKNIFSSLKVIKKQKPDLLYCPGPAALPWSAVCGSLMRKPVVWHLHHIFLDGPTKKLLNFCSGWKNVKKIIAISNCVGEQIFNKEGKQKIETLYNPVDVLKYANGKPDKILMEIEKALELEKPVDKDLLILTQIGAITKNKCQDLFVKTVFEIKKRNMNVVGLIIGDVITEADYCYWESIKKYISDNKLQRNIYAPGFRNDIADILSVTDCVVVPSHEGLGLVAMEAMSARKRVVGMNAGGSKEIIQTAGCGEMFPADGTEKEIADAVYRVLQQKDEQLDNGYHFCEQHGNTQYSKYLHEIFCGI